jgi:hypothetical protein
MFSVKAPPETSIVTALLKFVGKLVTALSNLPLATIRAASRRASSFAYEANVIGILLPIIALAAFTIAVGLDSSKVGAPTATEATPELPFDTSSQN